eukprot:TRINITY_DN21596_c0_g1_i1.p1 TRINITY_DN21596_c0_g1~~TRINITY_DN21596_c0_g1_i1.p1  ORF type:complete len:103 (+),score=11.70 TRINITY_DN21596_c0_g1_i1:23-331(+)
MSKEADFELFDPSAKYQKRSEDNVGKNLGRLGIIGGIGGVAYMIRNFRNRSPDMKLSVYVIHTRLLAQGTVIGVLSLGMIYQMYTKMTNKREVTQPQPVSAT